MLFLPASLYLGLLQQGAADLGMVSLLILDEVHQVTKEHAFSTLLRDFHWKLPSDCAPKVPCTTPRPHHHQNDDDSTNNNSNSHINNDYNNVNAALFNNSLLGDSVTSRILSSLRGIIRIMMK